MTETGRTPANTPLPQRIAKCIRLHPDWGDERVSNAMQCRIGLVRNARDGGLSDFGEVGKRGKTLQQFREQFDVRERIRKGIKTHLTDVYMTDQEFREVCGVPSQDWRRFADLEQFEAYRWRYRAILYWGQPKILAQMREIVGAV